MYALLLSARHCPIWQRSFDIEARGRRLDHYSLKRGQKNLHLGFLPTSAL
jgi:hypothetical protein